MAKKTAGRLVKSAGKRKDANGEAAEASLLTLSEVAARTKISMPTLQRYKKLYQARIPSVGKGRTQRYPEEALAIFEELRKENIGRRGRPRKDAAAAPAGEPARRGPKPGRLRAERAAGGDDYLTLTTIAERTGISYPTLVRYSKVHAAELPSRGTGRSRRYAPAAVEVFLRLRSESPRGRRPKNILAPARPVGRPPKADSATRGTDAQVAARLAAIERAQAGLERQLQRLLELVSRPVRITVDRR
ncbi:MAG: hypothetical protein SF066_19495 [Thermoanaerobaculia bacterium]|nr:hypothetical protein [Thermoanaerobaculia bacterium]